MILLLACEGSDPTDTPPPAGTSDTGTPTAGALHWTPLPTDGPTPRWGALSAGDGLQLGGLDATMQASAEVLLLDAADDALRAEPIGTLTTERYCGCAVHDPGRDRVFVFGGRNGQFFDEATAEQLDTSTGLSAPLDDAGAAASPVGCWAFFSQPHDRGYVFGGAGGGGFSGETWRLDPATGDLTALGIEGPSPRYDAGLVQLEDGTALLVGGLGSSGFDSEVWRFDPDSETWTELPASTEPPAGRRFPFTATDGQRLFYGFGTDSPAGDQVRQDLWSFDLQTGAWERHRPEGDRPSGRSFAASLPGPPGSLGVIAFGIDASMAVLDDAWVLWPQGS